MKSKPTDETTRALRDLLGLRQRDMAQLLGIEEKSLARLETAGGWTPTMLRLVRLVGETRVGDLERVLSVLTDGIPPEVAGPLSESVLEAARRKTAEQRAGPETLLRELLQRTPRPRRWVYWATSARASRAETQRLADEDGVICRPVLRGGEESSAVVPYLLRLQAGDDVLLCHNGEPLRWYRLVKVSRQAVVPAGAPPNLPFVRYVGGATPLGQRLAEAGYRGWDGQPARSTRGLVFSALAVDPAPLPVAPPAPRPPGIRDTMTPFRGVADAEKQ